MQLLSSLCWLRPAPPQMATRQTTPLPTNKTDSGYSTGPFERHRNRRGKRRASLLKTMNAKSKARRRRISRINSSMLFECFDSQAQRVCIAGSFNEWRPAVSPMIPLGGGRWAKRLCLPSGRHEYQFVVDGRWVSDSKADAFASNPYGGVNAVLEISEPCTSSPRNGDRRLSNHANPCAKNGGS